MTSCGLVYARELRFPDNNSRAAVNETAYLEPHTRLGERLGCRKINFRRCTCIIGKVHHRAPGAQEVGKYRGIGYVSLLDSEPRSVRYPRGGTAADKRSNFEFRPARQPLH